MKILFLDQSGNLGGAELNLLDLGKFYRDSCLVSLFADGSFREALEENQIPVRILATRQLKVNKNSNFWQSITKVGQLIPLIKEVLQLSHDYDLIYANTQKAMIVGAIVSFLTRKPLIFHLHDILSPEHFSQVNRQLAVSLANSFASLIIANSQATKEAFMEAGGRKNLVKVVYNGFDLEQYQNLEHQARELRQELNLEGHYLVGNFSRLSPWKGQHILLEALTYCPNAIVLLVGDALFGEDEYVEELHQQVKRLGLDERVIFLGFRSDIPQLMSMCDLVVHTSIAPEPFGRVIVEAMLCRKPIIATAAGGAVELIENGVTGWLTPSRDPLKLAEIITQCQKEPETAIAIAQAGEVSAKQHFNLSSIEQQIDRLLNQI
ncbi:MAG: glycosyltransferase [Waterburya sp.]